MAAERVLVQPTLGVGHGGLGALPWDEGQSILLLGEPVASRAAHPQKGSSGGHSLLWGAGARWGCGCGWADPGGRGFLAPQWWPQSPLPVTGAGLGGVTIPGSPTLPSTAPDPEGAGGWLTRPLFPPPRHTRGGRS